jgi:7-cyano-7-deazaguanine synthase
MDRIVVAIVSGGLDSTVLAYKAQHMTSIFMRPTNLHIMSFDYGQRHKKELEYAADTADRLNATFHLVDISTSIGPLLAGRSALTSPEEVEVPHGHYAADNMAVTVVPNRNQIMLSIALAYAHSIDADSVATAVHSGDHAIYPDCRPEFIQAMAYIARLWAEAGHGFGHADIDAPFLTLTKAEIVAEGARIGVPFEKTWSCYEGGELHCGRCSTCVERREAFHLAGVEDPTKYADADYWKEVTEEWKKTH